MNDLLLGILIILAVIVGVGLWKLLKPYFIKYDNTLCIVGGLGSGKTLTATKTARILIKRTRIVKYYIPNFFIKIRNYIVLKINALRKLNQAKKIRYNMENHKKKYKIKEIKYWSIKPLKIKPMLYTNYPVCLQSGILWWKKQEWSKQITADIMTCFKNMEEYSVVIIDEFPQFINQFNWNEEIIQNNVNEWITFFRHYVGGYLLCTAQSVDDIVVQVRRKLNQAIWCFDFKKWFFGLFYTIRMCDIMLSDQVGTMSTTFIEDNTKLHFGLFPKKGTYDTRCYSERTNNALIKEYNEERYKKLKTNKIIRLQKYTSPLDDTTTEAQKKEQYKKGENIWKN